MNKNLNMNNFSITNMKTSNQNNNAATVEYVNQSHISSYSKNNVFDYMMLDVDKSSSEERIIVEKIDENPASYHTINKMAFFSDCKK